MQKELLNLQNRKKKKRIPLHLRKNSVSWSGNAAKPNAKTPSDVVSTIFVCVVSRTGTCPTLLRRSRVRSRSVKNIQKFLMTGKPKLPAKHIANTEKIMPMFPHSRLSVIPPGKQESPALQNEETA